MQEKVKGLSELQKNLLLKKFDINLDPLNQKKIGKIQNIDFGKPYAFNILPPDFNNIKSLNYKIPPPKPNYVQVKAKNVCFNFRDLLIGLGIYPHDPGVPSIMGIDYSGVVVACGENVKDFNIGDEVIVTLPLF